MRRFVLVGVVAIAVLAILFLAAHRAKPGADSMSPALDADHGASHAKSEIESSALAVTDAPPARRTSIDHDGTTSRFETPVFSGELIIPKEWSALSGWMAQRADIAARPAGGSRLLSGKDHVELVSKPPQVEGAVYAWTIHGIPPGKYEILTYLPPHSIEAVLDATRSTKIRIDVPLPCRVFIDAIDSKTGNAVGARFFKCTPRLADGSFHPSSTQSHSVASTNRSVVECVPGDVRISRDWNGSKYTDAFVDVKVNPGDNYVTLQLDRATSLHIRVVDGTSTVPEDAENFTVTAVGHAGRVQAWKDTNAGDAPTRRDTVLALVTQPGAYRVGLPAPSSEYLVPDEQLVDLKAGTMTDVVFQLTKKP